MACACGATTDGVMAQIKLFERPFKSLRAASPAGLQRAASPLPGDALPGADKATGSPRKTLFLSFGTPPAAARRRRKRTRGHPWTPVRGVAPDNPPGRPIEK